MQISKLSLMASLAGAAMLQLHGQPASPELQDKALELLRQSLAQGAQPAAKTPAATQPVVTQPVVTQPVVTQPVVTQPVVTQPVVTEPVVTQPVVAQPITAQPVSGDLQDQAVQRLRDAMSQERSAAPASTVLPSGTEAKAKPAPKSSKSSRSSKNNGNAAAHPAPSETPAAAVQPAPAEQTPGVKTKQQRLMDLLEQYRADKLTPAQYHAQRAQILAEP